MLEAARQGREESLVKEVLYFHHMRDLDTLWELLQNEAYFHDNAYGLRRVRFSMPIDDFVAEYDEQVKAAARRGHEYMTHVTTSIDEVLQLLHGSKIRYHHLSCAAPKVCEEDEVALCIHYSKDDQLHAVSLPGVNYILVKTE